ncbi:lipoate--protein ligase [Acidithiobacillus sp. M4-SHS-6]|uniref:lipoate--protein ligase n=1 Tax=Acidithiobacillus sp. M4-SHS-6 TaxID=3383024 RepID=UPI0039BE1233
MPHVDDLLSAVLPPIRVLDFGRQAALRSQAVYHGVAEAMSADGSPVLCLVTPQHPYVCIGAHQAVEQEVDEAYCAAQGLPVIRRHVGGGAVYLDENQLFFHFVYPEQPGMLPVSRLYTKFIEPVLRTYRRFGVEATMRPINDIHVHGRKIGGTGAATIGEAMVMVGSFLFDFDAEHMSHCLQVSSEKFRDKLYNNLRDYITSFRRELGDAAPEQSAVKAVFLEEVAATLDVQPLRDEPTAREWAAIAEWEDRLNDPEWTYRQGRRFRAGQVKIAAGTHLTESSHKAPGGLIRVRMLVRDDCIADLELSGDFTCLPESGVENLAKGLLGASLDPASLQDHLSAVLKDLQLDMPGVTLEDLWTVLRCAAEPPA